VSLRWAFLKPNYIEMDLLKTILFLSIMVLILVGIMAHREMNKKPKPVKIEYKLYNINF